MKVTSPKAMNNVNLKVKPSDGDWNTAKAKRKQALKTKPVVKPKQVSKATKVKNPTVLQKAPKKVDKPKQIWKQKPMATASQILETKGDMCLQEVSYIDSSGIPRTTMTWVPKSN